jgi:magnesium transporter
MENDDKIATTELNYSDHIRTILHQQLANPALVEMLNEFHPFDIASTLLDIEPDIRKYVFRQLPIAIAANIFEHFEHADQINFIKELDAHLALSIIDHMETDDAVDLLQYLEDQDEDIDFVNLLSPKKRAELKRYWSYEDDEIGSVMSNSFIELAASMTVRDAMKKVTGIAGETAYISILFVVEKQKLVGWLRLKTLIIARANEIVAEIMESRILSAKPKDDKEAVAQMLSEYGVSSLPIVDDEGHMVGIVTHDDLMDVIADAKNEDYVRFAALTTEDIDLRYESVRTAVKKRLPWLSVLLGLSLFTAVILSFFEGIFSGSLGAKLLAANLAIYLPLILDMSGNTGTQSLAVMIRYLSTNKTDLDRAAIRKYLLRELATGIAQGLMLGILIFFVILGSNWISKGSFQETRTLLTAGVTAGSIAIALVVSTVLGAFVPLLMTRLKIDPAVASGPFITTISDIVTLIIYYSISLAILLPFYA